MAETLVFHCVCGYAGVAPTLAEQPWSQIAGYHSFSATRWSQSKAFAALAEPPWTLLAEPPRSGQIYWLRLGMPFATPTGEEFWCVYEAPELFVNGMPNSVEDIGSIRLVRCRLVGWEWADDKNAVGEVEVIEVRSLEQLRGGPAVPLAEGEQVLASFLIGQLTAKRWGEYWLLDNNLEGDMGNWMVLTGRDAPTHLLLRGEWGQHEDAIWAGNGLLTAGQAKQVLAMFSVAGD